jgi:citrate synthase
MAAGLAAIPSLESAGDSVAVRDALVTLGSLAIPPPLVHLSAALGRSVGTLARLVEIREHSRLFRPLENYVGPAARPFVPVGSRT